MDVLGGLAALLNKVPFILSERSSAAAYAPGWKTHWRLMVGRRAACVIANAGGGVDYWRSHLPKERLFLIRNFIVQNEQVQQAPNLAASIGAGTPIVLFAGRFSYEKNIPCLIEALIAVAKRRPDVAIMMFGEGPERHPAEVRIAESGTIGQIRIGDHSTHLPAWMSHAAVCVSVSHFEGQPNVVMEAAAVGCPLVLSDIAAHRELFDESEVLFAPADSAPLIARAVLEALQSPTQARERAQRARDIALRFNLPTVLAAYKSVYEAAAEARP